MLPFASERPQELAAYSGPCVRRLCSTPPRVLITITKTPPDLYVCLTPLPSFRRRGHVLFVQEIRAPLHLLAVHHHSHAGKVRAFFSLLLCISLLPLSLPLLLGRAPAVHPDLIPCCVCLQRCAAQGVRHAVRAASHGQGGINCNSSASQAALVFMLSSCSYRSIPGV